MSTTSDAIYKPRFTKPDLQALAVLTSLGIIYLLTAALKYDRIC